MDGAVESTDPNKRTKKRYVPLCDTCDISFGFMPHLWKVATLLAFQSKFRAFSSSTFFAANERGHFFWPSSFALGDVVGQASWYVFFNDCSGDNFVRLDIVPSF